MNMLARALTVVEIQRVLEALTPPERPAGSHLSDIEMTDFVEEILSPADQIRIERHLELCDLCAAEAQLLLDERDIPLSAEVAADEQQTGASLLDRLGLIESGLYGLPSGGTASVHFSAKKMAESEGSLTEVALLLHRMSCHLNYDLIVGHSWPMELVSRRLAKLRQTRCAVVVLAEGSPPHLAEPIKPGARVLIVTDVVATGRTLDKIRQLTGLAGGVVVGALTVLKNGQVCPDVLALDERDLDYLPARDVNGKEVWDFNPTSSELTHRKDAARSISDFLRDYPAALRMWEEIDSAGAYEQHRVEHRTHYIGFVDVPKLLNHPGIGVDLAARLLTSILSKGPLPEAVVIPARSRARRTLQALVDAANRRKVTWNPVVVECNVASSTELEASLRELYKCDVLVLDSAVAHGRTIDEIVLALRKVLVRSVSAAVVVSRMSESCEHALQSRLAGRWSCEYHIPIRPISVSSKSNVCPMCGWSERIKSAALSSKAACLVTLSEAVDRMRRGRRVAQIDNLVASQGELFQADAKQLLANCRPRTASGITLHAYFASQNNGMAPLAIPEVLDRSLSASRRVAIIRNLPARAVLRSPECYRAVASAMSPGEDPTVWLAASAKVSELDPEEWLQQLNACLLAPEFRSTGRPRLFWSWVAFGLYEVARQIPQLRNEALRQAELCAADDGEGSAEMRSIAPAITALM